ncbi:MAG: NAD(P)-dependent oxidoreductase [Pseudomonadota bacterium]|nr:NAD(P)-dependent oxidoreductase [Pseudomonadota bacterium]
MDILLLENLAADACQWLAERYEVHYRPELLDDMSQLRSQLYKTRVLVAPSGLMVNSQLLDFAPRLSVLCRIHEDTENIDYEACQKRGVRVVVASGMTARANAEYLLSTLLSLFRHGVRPPGMVDDVHTRRQRGREINDSVIGLLGLSPPAQMLATMLVPLGARLVGYDPALHRSAEMWARLGVQPMGLPEMLEAADAVSMQMVYASRYQGLLNERVLSACKPGQMWTSISSPAFFDVAALAQLLRDGQISAFMLDSDDASLQVPGMPLRSLHSVHITPRLAPYTREAAVRGSWFLADRIQAILAHTESRPMALAR